MLTYTVLSGEDTDFQSVFELSSAYKIVITLQSAGGLKPLQVDVYTRETASCYVYAHSADTAYAKRLQAATTAWFWSNFPEDARTLFNE